ncbi:MAG TPA: serine protease [Thermoanaerobaculia bacterium]|nr:serine protease [Thermoanaerobaculia bacterium]
MRAATVIALSLVTCWSRHQAAESTSIFRDAARVAATHNRVAASLFQKITPSASEFNRALVARIERELDNRSLQRKLDVEGTAQAIRLDTAFSGVPSALLARVQRTVVIYPDEGGDQSKDDSREEAFPPGVTRTADEIRNIGAVAAMVPIDMFEIGSPPWKLKPGLSLNLCPKEKFGDQGSVARCTAFLVGESTLLTAEHCTEKYGNNLSEDVLFVFGFHMTNGVIRTEFSDDEVFRGSLVDAHRPLDYAVIQLDRPVPTYQDLPKRAAGTRIVDDAKLYAIGYPSGLPTKLAGGARILHNSDDDFLYATLDTFLYNSGSPVFNAATHELEGMVIKGVAADYNLIKLENCWIPRRCDSTCGGQTVTRITRIKTVIESAASYSGMPLPPHLIASFSNHTRPSGDLRKLRERRESTVTAAP